MTTDWPWPPYQQREALVRTRLARILALSDRRTGGVDRAEFDFSDGAKSEMADDLIFLFDPDWFIRHGKYHKDVKKVEDE